MSHYTIFLPAPSASDLKKDVRRTWVVEEHDLVVPDPQSGVQLSNDDMDVGGESLNDPKEKAGEEIPTFTGPVRSLEPPEMDQKESLGDACALLFSQSLSRIYDGAVLKEDDLDEEYAFSQADEISNDSGELLYSAPSNVAYLMYPLKI
jgi:hypothetical protein